MSKRILILYAKYGGGHFSTAHALHEYIEENYFLNTDVKCVDCVEYISPFLSSVTTGAYKKMVKNAPYAWKKVYYGSQKGFISKFSEKLNIKMAKRLLSLFKEFLPDIVISTHPFASQMTSYLKQYKNVNCKLATILTDFAVHEQWLIGKKYCDLYFVSNNNMKNDLISFNIPEEKIFVTGVPLSERFSSNFEKKEIYDFLKLDKNKKLILFFGGGEFGLGKSRTVKILKSLTGYLNNYQIVAISGKNTRMNKEFLKLDKKLKNKNLHIYRYTEHVPELMALASLVITKPGGVTSSESLASNLPMLIINPIPGQEEENAEFLEKNGAAVWLKKTDDIDTVINSVLNNEEKLKDMKNNCLKLGHKNSSKNICEILFK